MYCLSLLHRWMSYAYFYLLAITLKNNLTITTMVYIRKIMVKQVNVLVVVNVKGYVLTTYLIIESLQEVAKTFEK